MTADELRDTLLRITRRELEIVGCSGTDAHGNPAFSLRLGDQLFVVSVQPPEEITGRDCTPEEARQLEEEMSRAEDW